jgi:hypothetical protein
MDTGIETNRLFGRRIAIRFGAIAFRFGAIAIRFGAIAFRFGAIAIAGCTAASFDVDGHWSCADDPDCIAGYVCLASTCVAENDIQCRQDSECEAFESCSASGVCEIASPCRSNAACRPAERCDLDLGACVVREDACTSDAECAPLTCDAYAGQCVGCQEDQPCAAGVCDINTARCVECLGDSDCSIGVCDTARHVCVQCIATHHCRVGVCDTTNQVCVECVASSHCSAGVCDVASYTCVDCLTTPDCDTGICDASARTCRNDIECLVDGDCAGNHVCNLDTHTCVECTLDGHCAAGLACDQASNRCFECTTSDQCTGAVCDTDSNRCVECLSDNDCTSPDTCDLDDKVCMSPRSGCTDADPCSGGQVCNTHTSECVDCLDDGHCAPNVCNTDTGTCVACLDSGDCSTGVCDTEGKECVDCLHDGDCADRVCDLDTSTCVECISSSDCTDPPVCDRGSKTCVECSSSSDCTDPPVCDTGSFVCVGCVLHSDCETDEICDNVTQECVLDNGCIDPDCLHPDDDKDGDGLLNKEDACAESPAGFVSLASSDHDGDGCMDSDAEDADDDNDGFSDTNDTCPRGEVDWQAGGSLDHDEDGCRDDVAEDPDDDNDGILDDNDGCPTGTVGWTSSAVTDHDGDGCQDAGEDNDDDNDSVADGSDSDPNNRFACVDTDGDTCDDCSVTGGPPDPGNDGPDSDADGICDPWPHPSWASRKLLTVPAGTVASDLRSFPMLLDITDSDLSALAQEDGDDILFTDALGSPLAHELELYNGARGHLIAWIKVPSLASASDTEVFMYFANSSCTSQARRTAVWDAHYLGVWHLADPAVNEESGAAHPDATSNANHAVQNGNCRTPGKVGYGQDLGTRARPSDFIEVAPLSGSEANHVTLSCWLNSDDAGTRDVTADAVPHRCITQRRAFFSSRFAVGLEAAGTDTHLAAYWYSEAGAGIVRTIRSSTILVAHTWYHAAATWDGSTVRLYLDGVEEASCADSTLAAGWDSSTSADRGGFVIGGGAAQVDRTLDGSIDEARVSDIARDGAWIAASSDNQADPSGFVTVGPREDQYARSAQSPRECL